MRYFIELSYNGKNYHGWQVQPNAISVQEKLNDCLSTILGLKIDVVGAGRTDAGVHAKLMVAHFDVDELSYDVDALTLKMNAFLPNDISVFKIYKVKPEVHARFDALSRTYEYYLTEHKNPFEIDSAYRLYGNLDFALMNKAAKVLFEYTDFECFSKSKTDVQTYICKIMRAEWQQRGDLWVFTVQADRFLRNMVRAIVGTLIEVGQGKLDIEGFKRIIESKSRSKAGVSVPAQGLYLVDIEYDKEIIDV